MRKKNTELAKIKHEIDIYCVKNHSKQFIYLFIYYFIYLYNYSLFDRLS